MMNERSASLGVTVVVLVAACTVTVVPPPATSPAPEPAPVVVAAPAPVADVPDPPSRVGRLAYLGGTVSFRAGEADAWSPAEPNRPVSSGDRVWSDVDGRAEVDVGSSVLRVGPQSELDVVRLDERAVEIRLPQGTVVERVLAVDGDGSEIDAPNAAVSINRTGEYRVDVSSDGMTTAVTVWSGQATVSEAGSTFQVNARQTATVRGSDTPTFDLSDAGPPDGFARWSMGRDAVIDRVAAGPRYVPADMPGAGDLDAYGRWQVDPAVGPVWYPTAVPAGWAPYRTGHWVWVHPWGWTWVDEAPWGYAPYHYGRWAYVNGAWGWCPGRTQAAPVYAPALVVFVNTPAPRSAPGAGPAVGWLPLGPGEAYQPAYGASPAYRQRINVTTVTNVTNVTNITNVTNVYRNRTAPNAVTVVTQQAFAGAQPVAPHMLVATTGVGSGAVLGAAPAVAPTRQSLAPIVLPGRPGVLPVVPPATIAMRPVVSTHAPPPPPVPFTVQERALASNGGRPLPPSQLATLRPPPAAHADVMILRSAPPAAPRPAPAVATPATSPAAPPAAVAPPPAHVAPMPAPAVATPATSPAAPPAAVAPPPAHVAPMPAPAVATPATSPAAPPAAGAPPPAHVAPMPAPAVATPATSPAAPPAAGAPPPGHVAPTPTPAPAPAPVAAGPAAPHAPPPAMLTPVAPRPAPPATPPVATPAAAPAPVNAPPAVAPPPAHLTTPPPARPWQPGASTGTLDAEYKSRAATLEARHRDEDAHPREGETPAARSARHAAERIDLDAAYQHARTSGAPTLPAEHDRSPH